MWGHRDDFDAERGKDPECSAIHGMYFSFRNTHRFQPLVEVDVHLSFFVQVEGTQSNDVQDLLKKFRVLHPREVRIRNVLRFVENISVFFFVD